LFCNEIHENVAVLQRIKKTREERKIRKENIPEIIWVPGHTDEKKEAGGK
jgi:hypothetical protein